MEAKGESEGKGDDEIGEKDVEEEFQKALEDELETKKNGGKLSEMEALAKEEKEFENLMEEERLAAEAERVRRENQLKEAMVKIQRIAKKQLSNISKVVVDYGPPYDMEDTWSQEQALNLVALCSDPRVRVHNIHMILNDKVDPSIPDPNDLYYTALHHCARNANVLACRMLRAAQAKVNVTNELGQTPLSLATLIIHMPDKKANQTKLIKYLIDEGADIHVRDKAGYEALDYAVMNQNVDLVKLLLVNGATVLRNNYTLVAKRAPIMSLVVDPDVHALIYTQLKKETEAFAEVKAIEEEKQKREKESLRVKKLNQFLQDKRDRKREEEEQQRNEQRAKEVRAERVAKLKVTSAHSKLSEAQIAENRRRLGEYRKDTQGHWEWNDKAVVHRASTAHVYPDAVKTMGRLRTTNKLTKFNERWKSLTGKELEVTWARSTAFDIAGFDYSAEFDGPNRKEGGKEGLVIGNGMTDFRDENDRELEGDAFDDVMSSLVGGR